MNNNKYEINNFDLILQKSKLIFPENKHSFITKNVFHENWKYLFYVNASHLDEGIYPCLVKLINLLNEENIYFIQNNKLDESEYNFQLNVNSTFKELKENQKTLNPILHNYYDCLIFGDSLEWGIVSYEIDVAIIGYDPNLENLILECFNDIADKDEVLQVLSSLSKRTGYNYIEELEKIYPNYFKET